MTAGRKVSEDLCWTVVRLLLFLPIERVIQCTSLSEHQIRRLHNLFRVTGSPYKPPAHKSGRPKKLNGEDVAFLSGTIDKQCDTYLDELRDSLCAVQGVSVSASTIWRSLRRSGYTMKRLTRVALERSAEARAKYVSTVTTNFSPEQLVFVDESACDRRTTYRGRAWAISGERAVRKAFFVRGKRYSMLPALCLTGMLHLSIVEGSFDTEKFYDFVNALLSQMNPFPAENSVIVMDNCRIHKHEDILNLITSRGMRYVFLPPYSPDFNPIENAFSFIKGYIRRHGDIYRSAMSGRLSDEQVYEQLSEAVFSVTPSHARSWFHHAGYVL